MTLLTKILSFLNLIFGVVSFLPCLMAGLMSMDSPQAQDSMLAHIMMWIILTFPIVCFICSVIPVAFNRWSLYVAVFPIVEATVFITILWILSK
jgi:hypothetical protein